MYFEITSSPWERLWEIAWFGNSSVYNILSEALWGLHNMKDICICGVCIIWRTFWFIWLTASFCIYCALVIFRSCIAKGLWEHLVRLTRQRLFYSCFLIHAQTCMVSLIFYPDRARSQCIGASVHPPLPCRRQGWHMWNTLLRLSFCSGTLWDG